jgi:hypothetical protein
VENIPTNPNNAHNAPNDSEKPRPNGVRLNTSNLHSKHPSGIAVRLKSAGVDWIVDLAEAIKANNETRINMWIRLLPYLVVTQGHRRIKRGKGRASKDALRALDALEGRE